MALAMALTVSALYGCADEDRDDCAVGQENCACLNAMFCDAGLTCSQGICVSGFGDGEDADETDGAGDGDGDGDGDDTGDGDGDGDTNGDGDGDFSCESSIECYDDEICVEGECWYADLFLYDVTVMYFDPPVCRDGVGTAELRYNVYQDGTLTDSSTEATCRASWLGEPFEYDPYFTLLIEFLEVDAFFDDPIVDMCWQDANGDCTAVPLEILHDGGFYGTVGDSYVELVFDPIS